MAANDEYVNSEGLNVKRKEHPTEKRLKPVACEHQERGGTSQNSYMLDSVAQIVSAKQSPIKKVVEMTPPRPRQKIVHINDIFESDEESVASHDRDNGVRMKSVRSEVRGIMMQKENPIPKKKSKDPNRFMSDLDARLTKIEIGTTMDVESQESTDRPQQKKSTGIGSASQHGEHHQPLNLLQSFVNKPKKMDWIRDMTPKKLQESVSQIIPGLKQNVSATASNERQPLCEINDDDDDDYGNKVSNVQSSTIIGDSESEELKRIRQKMNAGAFDSILNVLDKNRHYLLVSITFLITIWFYFGSGKETDENIR